MPGNGSRHTGKSSGSNRVNVENNGSKVGEHRLCKLWKPALLFLISLFRSLFLLVIIGAQLFDHFFGFTRCCGMANDYLSRLINNDKAGDTQYLPFVSQFGV